MIHGDSCPKVGRGEIQPTSQWPWLRNRLIKLEVPIPYIFGLFLRPKFQGIYPQNMAFSEIWYKRYLHFRILEISHWSMDILVLSSGKLSHNYGKSPCFMGKSTISMAIFNHYFCFHNLYPLRRLGDRRNPSDWRPNRAPLCAEGLCPRTWSDRGGQHQGQGQGFQVWSWSAPTRHGWSLENISISGIFCWGNSRMQPFLLWWSN